MVDKAIREFRDRSDEGTITMSWGAGWWKSVLSSESRRMIKRVQALMSLVEGYSEHVMIQVGKQFPGHREMMEIFTERRRRKNIAERALEKLIGFDFKIKQYKLGEVFVSHIVEKEGIKFLNQAWQSRENLPTWQEIYQPDLWIQRMQV